MSSTVTIVGSLGRDPELRFTQSGLGIVNFSVAVNRRKKVGDEWEDETCWFNVSAWRELAENVAASMSKGDRVIVTGHMQESSWEDKDGNKRTKMELVADAIGAEMRFAQVEVARTQRTTREDRGGQQSMGDNEEPF